MAGLQRLKAKRDDWAALAMLLSAAAAVAYGYVRRVDLPNYEARFELHNQIVGGTAPSPYLYRVLAPAVAQLAIWVFSPLLSTRDAFLLAYGLFDLVCTTGILVLLFFYLRNWFARDQALIGVLFVAATMPIALQDHYHQPWSLLEAALFTAALHFAYLRQYGRTVLVALFASLNRETAVFIPLAFAFACLPLPLFARRWLRRLDAKQSEGMAQASTAVESRPWQELFQAGGLFLIWAAVSFGLRYVRGPAAPVITLGELLARNTALGNLALAAMNGGLFLGVFWVLAVLGYRRAPPFVQRAGIVIPLYLAAVAVWGAWLEVRLLMPLYPILVPSALAFVFRRGAAGLPPDLLRVGPAS